MAQLVQLSEVVVKPTPSIGYNSLSATGNLLAFSHQQECVIVRPLGPHKLPIKDADKSTITSTLIASVRGRVVAAVVTNASTDVWDVSRDVPIARIVHVGTEEARGVAVLEIGERLIVLIGHGSGVVTVVELAGDFTPTIIAQPNYHARAISALTVSHGAHTIVASGDACGGIALWGPDFAAHSKVTQQSENECVTSIAIAQSFVVAAFGCGKIRGYFAHNAELRLEICAHSRWINAMSYCPSRNVVATVGDDSVVAVWQLPSTANPRAGLVGAKQLRNLLLTGVAFNAEGKLVTASYDSDKLLVFDLP